MTKPERNFDDDSYDEVEERLREQDPDEEDRAYYPVEESKPPHYWIVAENDGRDRPQVAH